VARGRLEDGVSLEDQIHVVAQRLFKIHNSDIGTVSSIPTEREGVSKQCFTDQRRFSDYIDMTYVSIDNAFTEWMRWIACLTDSRC
jgi:hypothetical protein